MKAIMSKSPTSQIEQAYSALRADLLSCAIRPGQKIKIRDICAAHEFSPGAVREALSKLTSDGLVVAEPQKGFSASPISRSDLLELTTSRALIEGHCVRLSVEAGDPCWESKVLAAHHTLSRVKMRRANGTDQLDPAWMRAHSEFHHALASGCENRWLLRTRGMLYEQSERYRNMSVPLDEHDRDIPAEHKAICDAALSGNADEAERLVREHIERTTTILTEGLARLGPSFSIDNLLDGMPRN